MTDQQRLDQIQARADLATEGPWGYTSGMDHRCYVTPPVGHDDCDDPIAKVYGSPEALFIAHAREDVPALVAAVRAVLDLHQPEMFGRRTVCSSCLAYTSPMPDRIAYPCDTVRVVAAALRSDR